MPSNHSSTHSGLQSHSVGEIYPYSIKRIGDSHEQVFHCLTGIEYGSHPLSNPLAYEQAEQEAKALLAFDNLHTSEHEVFHCEYGYREISKEQAKVNYAGDQVNESKQDCLLTEYSFLVPTLDNNKAFFACHLWTQLERALVEEFKGYSVERGIHGVWVNNEGKQFDDSSRRYIVAIPQEKEAYLLDIIDEVKRDFKQESIYLSRSASVRLV